MNPKAFLIDFLNTYDPMRPVQDLLADGESCRAFLTRFELDHSHVDWARTSADLVQVRTRLRRAHIGLATGTIGVDELARELNHLLRGVDWRGTVRRHASSLELVFEPDDHPDYAKRVTAVVVSAFVETLARDGVERVRQCESPPCEALFMDQTKAGRQRYCGKRCANRANVAAHRRRIEAGS